MLFDNGYLVLHRVIRITRVNERSFEDELTQKAHHAILSWWLLASGSNVLGNQYLYVQQATLNSLWYLLTYHEQSRCPFVASECCQLGWQWCFGRCECSLLDVYSELLYKDASMSLVICVHDEHTETTCLTAVVTACETDFNRDDIYCVRITSGGKFRNLVDYSLKILTVSVCNIDWNAEWLCNSIRRIALAGCRHSIHFPTQSARLHKNKIWLTMMEGASLRKALAFA